MTTEKQERRALSIRETAQACGLSRATIYRLIEQKKLATLKVKDYRSKGEQKMTVQHVHVADGGQAVIGNVSTPTPGGGGASEKMKEQPHAQLAYAPGVEMPRQIEGERAPVPRALRSGT
jgi:hypothetical protein